MSERVSESERQKNVDVLQSINGTHTNTTAASLHPGDPQRLAIKSDGAQCNFLSPKPAFI